MRKDEPDNEDSNDNADNDHHGVVPFLELAVFHLVPRAELAGRQLTVVQSLLAGLVAVPLPQLARTVKSASPCSARRQIIAQAQSVGVRYGGSKGTTAWLTPEAVICHLIRRRLSVTHSVFSPVRF